MLTETELVIARAAGFVVTRRFCEIREDVVETIELADETRIIGMSLEMASRPTWFAVIHRCTHPGERTWQVSFFDELGAWGHTCRSTLTEALELARRDGFFLTSVHQRLTASPRRGLHAAGASRQPPESDLDEVEASGDRRVDD